MKKFGFTLIELTAVAGFVAATSVGTYTMMRKGQDATCINNLRQIGLAVTMFKEDNNGFLPSAKLFPSDKNDPHGINNLLKPYISAPQTFFCPNLPEAFNVFGTNYLWNDNDNDSGVIKNADSWLMTEIIAVDKNSPSPHTGGFCVLYASGEVKIGPRPSFPKVTPQKTEIKGLPESQILVSKEESPPEEKKEVKNELTSYSLNPVPQTVTAGKPVVLDIQSLDQNGQIMDYSGKVLISDLSGSVGAAEISVQKGKADFPVIFKTTIEKNLIFVYDEKGRWMASNDFSVVPSDPQKIEADIPPYIIAGQQTAFTISLADAYGNKIIPPEALKFNVEINPDSEYPKETTAAQNGEIVVPVTFFSAGNNDVIISLANSDIKKELTVKVKPGILDHFEINPIKSPVEAGQPVQISIKGIDKWGNKIKGFEPETNPENFKYLNEDFSSGSWIETIFFTKASPETVFEIDDGFGHKGKSNVFEVIPASPKSIETENKTVSVMKNEEFVVPFTVVDRFGNFIPGQVNNIMVEGMDNCNVETETNKGSYKIKCTSAKSKDEGVVLKNLILSLKNTPDIKLGIKCLLLPPNTILKDKKK